MTPPPRDATRALAVEQFLDDLSKLLVACYSVPHDEQEVSWAADAEKITGHVALALATARARLVPRAGAVRTPLGLPADRYSGPTPWS